MSKTRTYRLSPTKLRKARGDRTQVEVAAAAGITQGALSQMETGQRHNPSLETVLRLATALGVRVEDITD